MPWGLKRWPQSATRLIPPPQSSEPARNNFDAIRIAMATLVVWSHSFALHLGSERTEWISLALGGAYNAGNLAVMAFFVVSGFLITQSWEKSSSARSYFEKRVRRIYPGFLVCVVICALSVGPMFGGELPDLPKFVGLNLLLKGWMPPAFPGNYSQAINGSLWSISYEFWCYVGVAIGASWLMKKPRLLVALCPVVITMKVIQDAVNKKPGHWLIGLLFGWPYLFTKMVPLFLTGVIVYRYRESIPRSRIILLGLLTVGIIGCHFGQAIADFVVPPALAYVVFYVAFSQRVQLHEAARFGDASYGIYLYAFPIQQILQATIGRSLNVGEFAGLSMVLSLFAGFLSWHLVEKHFLPRRMPRDPALVKSPGSDFDSPLPQR